ncbi:MAG: tetratricopeptide repeat protein, partial [Planctomycetes bacterium]|nr:tetratricopeptide repeat protein [Planctomycetota bacterium]
RCLAAPTASVIPAAVAFSVTCCVHLSAGLMFPSLVWLCLANGGLKPSLVRLGKALLAAAIPALAFLGLVLWLGYDGPPWGVQELGGWDKALWVAFTGPPRNPSQYVFLSRGHLRFLFNEHVLISAVGLPLLALMPWLGRAAWRERTLPFLALMSAFFLAYTIFFNPDLGFLDWDLFAAAALPCTLLGGYVLVRLVLYPAKRDALGLSLAAVALMHTLPFVVNRAAVGKAEKYFAIGRFYEVQAKLPQAAAHFEKGLTLDPQSWKAHLALGFVYADMGQFDRARREWAEALRINPGCREAKDNLQKLDELERRAQQGRG